MTTLTVNMRDGTTQTIEADGDVTLMEALRTNGVEDLLALCGGCCSCATCHVFLKPEVFSALGQPCDDENDLLDSSDHRTEYSRLSCQVSVSALPDGCTITIAPED